jgi:predicted transcriptional regulator
MYKKEFSININWKALKDLRISMWYSIRDFAKIIWISHETINNIENRDWTVFIKTAEKLKKIALGWNIWPFEVKPLDHKKRKDLFNKLFL